jgi:hypothetical protein
MAAAKCNGLDAPHDQLAKTHTKDTANSIRAARFTGTENPRHLRVIHVLLTRPLPRQQLDAVAGASNGPELVAELRRRGLDVPCERISFIDRDGKPCRPGVYSLTLKDRRMIYGWMAKRKQGGANA